MRPLFKILETGNSTKIINLFFADITTLKIIKEKKKLTVATPGGLFHPSCRQKHIIKHTIMHSNWAQIKIEDCQNTITVYKTYLKQSIKLQNQSTLHTNSKFSLSGTMYFVLHIIMPSSFCSCYTSSSYPSVQPAFLQYLQTILILPSLLS